MVPRRTAAVGTLRRKQGSQAFPLRVGKQISITLNLLHPNWFAYTT